MASSSSSINDAENSVNYQPEAWLNPLEVAFRMALERVRFLGGEVERIRELIESLLNNNSAYELAYYNRQLNTTLRSHEFWRRKAVQANQEWLESMMCI